MSKLVEQVASPVDSPSLRVFQYELSPLVKTVADDDEVAVWVYLKLACDLADLELWQSSESCRWKPLSLLGVLEAFEHVQNVAHHVLTHFLSSLIEVVLLVHSLLSQLLGRILRALDFRQETRVSREEVIYSEELKHVCLDCPLDQRGVLVLKHEQRLAIVVAVVVLVTHAVSLRELAHSQVEVRILEHFLRPRAARLRDEVEAPVKLIVTILHLQQLLHGISLVLIVPDLSETDAASPLVLQSLLIVQLLDFHESAMGRCAFPSVLDVHALDQLLQEHGLLRLGLAEGLVVGHACHHLKLAGYLTWLDLRVLLRHHFGSYLEEFDAHEDQEADFEDQHLETEHLHLVSERNVPHAKEAGHHDWNSAGQEVKGT